jgi:hypothetical protein
MNNQAGNLLQNQSLLNQKPTPAVRYWYAYYKLTALNTFAIASAVYVSYAYRVYFEGSTSLWVVLLAVALFGVFSVLELFLNKEALRRSVVIALQIAGLLLFFLDEPRQLLTTVFFVLVFLFAWGESDGRKISRSLLSVRFMWTAKFQLKKVITALVLMGVLFYIPFFDRKQTLIYPSQFDTGFAWGVGVAHNFYPAVKFDGSFAEFRDSFVRSELAGSPEFRALPQSEQAKVVQMKSAEFTDALAKNLGIAINPAGLSRDVFYQSLEATLKNWRKEFGSNFTAAWALTLFLIVQGFGLIFYSLIAFIAYLVYELLIALGAVHVVGETKTSEWVSFT